MHNAVVHFFSWPFVCVFHCRDLRSFSIWSSKYTVRICGYLLSIYHLKVFTVEWLLLMSRTQSLDKVCLTSTPIHYDGFGLCILKSEIFIFLRIININFFIKAYEVCLRTEEAFSFSEKQSMRKIYLKVIAMWSLLIEKTYSKSSKKNSCRAK